MKKVVSIIGNRPNTLKWSILSPKLRKEFEEIVIHTGQHYDYSMNGIFFKDMNLRTPDYFLNVGSGSHGLQTGKMLIEIEKVLLREEPDCVVLFGDTNTTLAGALASKKLHFKIAHIEAGVRSFNQKMPEEVNRILVDHCSDYLFCPTQKAIRNLCCSEIKGDIYYCGDVLTDLVYKYGTNNRSDILYTLNLEINEYYVVTIHRVENTVEKSKLVDILQNFFDLNLPVVFPCHPRTWKKIIAWKLMDTYDFHGMRLIDPVGYVDMLCLIQNAKRVCTDSGGVQRESLLLNTPCTILREETEWVGLDHDIMFKKEGACKRIVAILKEVL